LSGKSVPSLIPDVVDAPGNRLRYPNDDPKGLVRGTTSIVKLYVGNLSYDTTDSDLRAAFAGYGEVTSAEVVNDRDSGRPRGFGFVEMASQAEAQAAINAVNGSQLQGRTLNVNEAKARTDRSPSGSRGGYGGGSGRW
jgi:cold-inducible RNA-binding protein